MNCPDCGGPMWDNRETKRKPTQPDYKCKDKDNCGKGVWIEKRGGNGNGAAPTNGNGHAATTIPTGKRPLGPLYGECLEFARKACAHYLGEGVSNADVIAAAATLFIAATRDGGVIRTPKPAPPPPPPKPPEPEPEYEYSTRDDLPF